MFADLQRRYPGRFADGQLRTLQRRIKQWRAHAGPAKEVFFAQVHHPGRLGARDFTHCTDLGVTINGQPFRPPDLSLRADLLELGDGTICFSESFESLSEGLQNALWELGGVPQRAPHGSADARPSTPAANGERRSRSVIRRCCVTTVCRPGDPGGHGNENGDVEQSHRQFKRAVDQALMLRGSRDFASRERLRGVRAAAV